VILLDNVTKRFGPKILFENVSMQFDPGKRYGLTGANGAGKSTLLKMLSGEEDSDAGSISIPGSLRLGVLRQNHFAYESERILDAVMMGNQALWSALQEKDRLLAGEVTDEIGLRLGELEGTIAEENGYVAESDAAELLVGLGLPTEQHAQTMSTLPSGYKLRVLLAQVLFSRPDVLLLDEPTNHLDLDSIRWLESFLIGFRGTLVVVSHDRHFLNSVVTHVADVDYQTITVYTGNYAEFVSAKYENRARAEAQNASAKKKIAELQSFVDRFGSHASKSKQAQSRVKQIEKLEVKELKRSSLVRPFNRF
jgi:ATPase subunit of ABC transporter with duplicated ATPase domains